jgi:hypothetical protein
VSAEGESELYETADKECPNEEAPPKEDGAKSLGGKRQKQYVLQNCRPPIQLHWVWHMPACFSPRGDGRFIWSMMLGFGVEGTASDCGVATPVALASAAVMKQTAVSRETTRRTDTLQWSDGTVPPRTEAYLANAC